MSAKPAIQNFDIKQGDDWYATFNFYDQNGNLLDLTGCTLVMQIKSSIQMNLPVCTPMITLLSTNSTPQVQVVITKAQSSIVPCYSNSPNDPTQYFYDLKITDSYGATHCPFQGAFNFYGEVTR